jgi:hypothetical protein
MSLFSRLFRKAPLPSVSPGKPAAGAEVVPLNQTIPDRASIAAREEAALKTALEDDDFQAVARLVVGGSSTKIRQRAAEKIEDPEILRQLVRDVRGGNDKNVYRILTRKRDALVAHGRKLEQLRAEIEAASAAIERHSHRSYEPLFGPALEQLENRWNAIAPHAQPELIQKTQRAVLRCRDVIAQHLRQIEEEVSRTSVAASAAAEAQRLRQLQEEEASAVAAKQAAVLEEQRQARADKQAAEALALRQLGLLIRRAQGALNVGRSRKAAEVRRLIEEQLPAAPALPVYLSNQLQQLDTALNELRDWKSFSVTPKRIELMEEMESLAGSTLDPMKLADQIKALRREWRTLSKGAGENLEADQQRFQAAAEKAFQPCREYFAAQALARQENLQRREALLERLTAFESQHDWDHPAWDTVLMALRQSRQDWSSYVPVDRAAGNLVQDKFVAVTLKLQGRLHAEYERNVQTKHALIERAQKLGAADDSRKAIDDVKELQRIWKTVGPVPRDQDHHLWERFRQHCDAVFQKRQQDFAEYAAGLEANKAQAVELCEQLDELRLLEGTQLLASSARLIELRQAFATIGDLPKADSYGVRSRFERALRGCEEAITRQKAKDAQHSWVVLFEAANQVRAYKLSIVRDAEPAQRDALRQAAESYIQSVNSWPKRGLEAITKHLAAEASSDLDANELALRMLCVRAEIHTDTPTPQEDHSLRRQYQVQRLIQSMGQGIAADDTRLDALAIEWIGVGPTDEATYAQLSARFIRNRR